MPVLQMKNHILNLFFDVIDCRELCNNGGDFLLAPAKIDCEVLLNVVERSGHIVLGCVGEGEAGWLSKGVGGFAIVTREKNTFREVRVLLRSGNERKHVGPWIEYRMILF
jgi:hypothetical protein